MFDHDSPEIKLRAKLWKGFEDDRTVMLGLKGVEDDRTRPMTAQVDKGEDGKDEAGKIYFFGSKSDGIGQALSSSSRAVATFASKGHDLFAHIHGTLSPSDDRAVIERLWNPIIASWYKDGKDDPDLQLIRFDTDKADVWEASAFSTLKAAGLKLLFNVDPGKEHQKKHQASVEL
ncbi:MAG: pyridoxamine 5'-phosphate oxidase family protein [Sphingomicrobium sp.]